MWGHRRQFIGLGLAALAPLAARAQTTQFEIPPLPEKPLRWQDYIKIDSSMSPETAEEGRRSVSETLNRLFAPDFPQGQRWLNKIRINQGQSKEKNITIILNRSIEPDYRAATELFGGWEPRLSSDTRARDSHGYAQVHYNPEFPKAPEAQYVGVDGKLHRLTQLHVLAHEIIGHAAIPNIQVDEVLAVAVTN